VYVHVILLVMTVLLAEQGGGLSTASQNFGWQSLMVAVLPQAMIVLLAFSLANAGGRKFDRTRRVADLVRFDYSASLAWLSLGAHVWAVTLGGWLQTCRTLVGDPVLVDELLTCLPAFGAVVGLMAARYTIERRIHEIAILSALEHGQPVTRLPRMGRWLSLQLRHQVLIILLPLLATTGWGETVPRLMIWLMTEGARRGDSWWLYPAALWLDSGSRMEAVRLLMQLAGVLAVLALMPLTLPWLWDVSPLRTGALAESLLAMCKREKVRVRDILLWRTDSSMLNGAVIGILPGARYVLLTDALVERLPREQLMAVMAHELAHAKLRHILWLSASLLLGSVAGGVLGWGMILGVNRTGWANAGAELWPTLLSAAVSVATGLLTLGFVSRRFEWQADAFAAKHLSRAGTWTICELPPPVVEAMSVGTAADPASSYGETEFAETTMADEGTGPLQILDAPVSIPPPPIVRTITASGTHIVEPAALAMAGALWSVAQHSGIRPEKWSFRHGSIAYRARRVMALDGMELAKLPIDRTVGRIKAVLGLGLLLGIGAAAWALVG